jgi:hypothetical protein
MTKQELLYAIMNTYRIINGSLALFDYDYLQRQSIKRLRIMLDSMNRQLQYRSYHGAIEHNCTFDKNGKAIDDMGNEYRDNDGNVVYK